MRLPIALELLTYKELLDTISKIQLELLSRGTVTHCKVVDARKQARTVFMNEVKQ